MEPLRQTLESVRLFLRESKGAGVGWVIGTAGTVGAILLRGLRRVGWDVPHLLPELLIGASFLLVFVASVHAYHRQRLQLVRLKAAAEEIWTWDLNALRIYDLDTVPLGPRRGDQGYMVRFCVAAKKSLPQPNKLRLWFNHAPFKYEVRAVLRTDHGELDEALGGRMEVDRKDNRLDLEFMSPPLDQPGQYLVIHAWAGPHLTVRGSAAYRLKD